MTIWEFLGTMLIGPLKLVFEVIYDYAYRVTNHPGTAIIFLSLIVNILVLPLYRRADAMQEANRDIETKLHNGVAHIKKTFSGDEQMMILQTYYLQNHYKPTDALRGSISLILEIPFFIAAYQFLSHLDILKGVSFGPIRNLGVPDGLLVLGGFTINLLPIIMTLINVISSALYLKGFPLKTKIQLYAMALFFLAFLYSSPACLVFYWTLNNIFSLIKNIFYKLKNPQKNLRVFAAILGIVILLLEVFFYQGGSLKKKLFLVGLGHSLLLPLCFPYIKKIVHFPIPVIRGIPDRRQFLLESFFLTVLVGLYIPSVFVAASPQEYVTLTYFHHPLWYIAYSFCYAVGTFLVWMQVFYGLVSTKVRPVFERLVWVMCGVMLINYMFFGTKLGTLSPSLQYENGLYFSRRQQMLNIIIVVLVAVILVFCAYRWKQIVVAILSVFLIAIGSMAIRNFMTIKASVEQISVQESNVPHFQLSKTGKNVVVIMLDRAFGAYVPYIFNEKPELKKQFFGFTHYANTISFGECTNFAAPELYGGYEYTPVEMNKRDTESLVSKHNEALKVLPVLFSKNGYEVTVCDPPYANYQYISDLSIYDDYPQINTYITNGQFNDAQQIEEVQNNNHRNFFCFSIMKTMPLFLQTAIYNSGRYHMIASEEESGDEIGVGFANNYNVLNNMSNMTEINEENLNTFLFLCNDLTHNPLILQEPDYIPVKNVDNASYDEEHKDRFVANGKAIRITNESQMAHYHVNMAAFLQLGAWFDYLRANDVYNNTRIILVSDHAFPLWQVDELFLDNGDNISVSGEVFYPLLMEKDFNSTGFITSNDFMTNADVPTLAVDGLIHNPMNPFTGKAIDSNEKSSHDQFIILSTEWHVDVNNGNTFLPAPWLSIKDNIWDKENWSFYSQETVLDKHTAP